MIMKRLFSIAAALAFLPALAMAAPDFSGSWVRDGANSDTIPNTLYWLTRGVDAGGARGPTAQVTIQVRQTGSNLQVVDPAKPQRNYTLDGKPYTVPTDTGIQSAVVTSTLQDSGLTIATTQPYGGMPGNIPLRMTETWSLSPDGRVLTINTIRDAPSRRETYKEQFNKR